MGDNNPEEGSAPISSLPLGQVIRASKEILELLPIATSICDAAGQILQYNHRAVELWGRAPRSDETYDQFTSESKYYDAQGRELQHARIADVLRTGKPVRNEEVLVQHSDGSQRVLLLNIDLLIDAQGKMLGAINCFQDVTERKRVLEELDRSQQDLRQQRERWNATYEHAAIGIVEIDAEGRILRINEALCAITGFSRDELLGWRLFLRTHPDDKNAEENLFRQQVAGDIGFYSREKRYIRKDGRIIWMSVRSSTVRDANGKFSYCVRVLQDITDRKEAEDRQKLLNDELNHRVKNMLATVQSLATQTVHGSDSLEVFRNTFEGRLIALSHVHDQLTRRNWKSADLGDVVADAMAPYITRSEDQIEISGESITVTPRVALTLALAMHELATNAAKHGALSKPGGRITVHWQVLRTTSRPPLLALEWREHGGQPVVAPTRRGFGSRFIENSIARELQGAAQLNFFEAGLCCTMEFPIDPEMVENRIDAT